MPNVCIYHAWKTLQVFHMSAIQRILNINMMEVQLYRISYNDLYDEFGIDWFENIMVSHPLHWIRKIVCMDKNSYLGNS